MALTKLLKRKINWYKCNTAFFYLRKNKPSDNLPIKVIEDFLEAKRLRLRWVFQNNKLPLSFNFEISPTFGFTNVSAPNFY